ncbi:MAG: type IV pilus secretin PilQ [Terriglobales bacterium]
MTQKLVLGTLVAVLVLGAMPLNAAVPQITQVTAAVQGDATVVTIRANGAFTHTEYRPTDNLLLVDLNGVSAGTDDKMHQLQVPGASAYRVLGYKGASGADVARVEITLAANVGVSVNEAGNELQVRLTGATSNAPETAETPAAPPAAAAPVRETSASLRDVQVSRAADGIEVSILATGPLTPKAMTLTSPDRLVIDLPNTSSSRKSREIAVNSEDVKAVRVARFQLNPPVTRIVVDLVAARDYQLLPDGNKLTLKFRQSESAAPAKDSSPMKEEQKAESANAAAAPAQDFVIVQPAFESKTPAQEPAARATTAAARFGSPQPEIAFSAPVTPPASASLDPQAANAAMMQAQAAPATTAAAGPRTTSCREATRFTGEPISLNLKDADVKDFFRLVHEISGLNVVLDPQVRGTVTIVLDDVPWDQALAIVLKNNNMECELDGNVLRIATLDTLKKEADSRKAQIDAQLLAVPKVTVTRFLSYARAQEITPTIKRFLTSRGEVIADSRTNALIIEDVPSVIPNVDRLLKELDRKTQEVEIEARVVAATRNFARDLGTQVGFGWGNNPTAVGGVGAVGASPINVGVSNPLYFTLGQSIPLFSNFPALGPTSGLAFTNASSNYRVDVLLTMAESRGLLKILSRPRIVTQNNIQALVKQGVRVPVVTSAQLGGPPTVQYVDAFLRLTVTPQITAERTIFLNVDVENTVPDFSRQVSGNPTLLTQQATTQVLVNDGGTVVIGGVIQTQNSVNIQQVPLLGNIPIFGELFKRRSVSTSTQELIFFITPKIIQT